MQINPGPVVTTFEFKPEAGIKYSRITSLCDDLCLALRAESILIERMAGKSTVGIQVPNHERETIWLREVVEAQEFLGTKSKLTLALGKDINGRIVTADLNAMPHLLIAGSTGSGKSVAINAFIMSILYKATPHEVRLILVDPKRLELGNYEGVPHLHTPIITEPKLASNALRNAVREMERRLKVLAEKGVRNIDQYNRLFDGSTASLFDEGDDEARPLPYIVIIIDELADLMMLDGQNVEASITRLAQMARAVGIHLVLATQRPSVDVITGLIKANFPARMSFRVATKIDSRTILDANGAEALLGRGDMLYLPNGSARVHRVHAPFVTEKEIAAVVEFWRSQGRRSIRRSSWRLRARMATPQAAAWTAVRATTTTTSFPGCRAHRAGVRQGFHFAAAAASAHRLRPRRSPHRPDGARRHRRRRRRPQAPRSPEASRLAQRSGRRAAVATPSSPCHSRLPCRPDYRVIPTKGFSPRGGTCCSLELAGLPAYRHPERSVILSEVRPRRGRTQSKAPYSAVPPLSVSSRPRALARAEGSAVCPRAASRYFAGASLAGFLSIESSSTSKISVEFGSMSGGAPRSPYARFPGMNSCHFDPTGISCSASVQPLMTPST